MKRILAMLCSLFFVFTVAKSEIPEVTMKQFDIPDNEALRFVRDMRIGFNLGNTFDAWNNGWASEAPLALETYWSHAKTTEALMDALVKAGFNALRLPVSWHDHMDASGKIDPVWLNRIHEVAGWALERGMYVIINVHHDNATDFSAYHTGTSAGFSYYPDEIHYEQSASFLTSVWQQLAEFFRDEGDHLLLESMNEPRLTGTDYEWTWDASSFECLEAMDCINRLNQLFVDTVRATGGNNATRYLLVPSYDASPWYACDSHFHLPEDPAGHIIIEAHAYTPYDFALNEKGTDSFDISNSRQKSEIGTFMNQLYNTWISNGVPVIIDEFGARNKNGNLQSRINFTAYYIASARARGITCFWWDNAAFTGTGECFGLINRNNVSWVYPEIVDAAMTYCR